MSWIENIKDKLIITTGDGKTYTPEWMDAIIKAEYNIARFNFINVPGTKVDRSQPLGTEYNLRIFFQGADHLATAEAFRISADDNRPWDISHPLYGKLTVQPVGLVFDLTKLNVSEITGTIIETITDDNPKSNIVPVDKITADKDAFDSVAAGAFANDIVPNTNDITTLTATNNGYYTEASKKITDTTESEKLINLYNDAQSALIEATTEPFIAMQKTQAFINYPPGLLSSPVQTRMKLLEDQLANINVSVGNILTKNEKVVYETTGANLLANMMTAAVNPQPGNYGTRNQVLLIITIIINNYNTFLIYLDQLQSANNNNPSSYIPNVNTLTALNDLVNYTVSNLFVIALTAKQERTIYIEDDSNVILLTHRFYGLDNEDAAIENFMLNNEIGLNEILLIKKGRKIIYYV